MSAMIPTPPTPTPTPTPILPPSDKPAVDATVLSVVIAGPTELLVTAASASVLVESGLHKMED